MKFKPMTKPELEARIQALITECDTTANELEAVSEDLRETRLELIASTKKVIALTRLLKVYMDVELGG